MPCKKNKKALNCVYFCPTCVLIRSWNGIYIAVGALEVVDQNLYRWGHRMEHELRVMEWNRGVTEWNGTLSTHFSCVSFRWPYTALGSYFLGSSAPAQRTTPTYFYIASYRKGYIIIMQGHKGYIIIMQGHKGYIIIMQGRKGYIIIMQGRKGYIIIMQGAMQVVQVSIQVKSSISGVCNGDRSPIQ